MNPGATRKERDRILGIGLGLTTTVKEAIQAYRSLVLDLQRSGWQLEPYLKDLEKWNWFRGESASAAST